MKEQRVAQILQGIAEDAVPDSLNLWPAIHAQVQPQRRPLPWTRLRPTTRLGWAFLVLTFLLVFGGTSWAVSSAIVQLFPVDVGLDHVERAGLADWQGATLAAVELLNGVTVEALAHADRFRPSGQPMAWLLGIAANLIKRKQAGRATRNRREPLVHDLYPHAQAAISEDDLFVGRRDALRRMRLIALQSG